MARSKRKEGEYLEQVKFFDWVRINRQYARNKQLREAMELCYSVPNGAAMPKQKNVKTGKWYSIVAKKMVKSGMESGIPDINLDYSVVNGHTSSDIYAGLRIEMKYGKNTLSVNQKAKRILFEKAGYKYAVCYSAKEAINAIIEYLPFKRNDYQV